MITLVSSFLSTPRTLARLPVKAVCLLLVFLMLTLPSNAAQTANTPGSLDPGFGIGGRVFTYVDNMNDESRAIALQPDGKIVTAGSTSTSTSAIGSSDFAVIRYMANGQLDPSFDGDGRVRTDFANGGEIARAIAIQPDGKILVAGTSYGNGSNIGDIAVVRYLPDGQLDPSFDGDGLKTTDFANSHDYAAAIAIQPDGKILVAGYTSSGNGDIAVVRYLPDGQLDSSFDGDGWLTTDFTNDGDYAAAMTIQPDGKILITGYKVEGFDFDTVSYIVVVRYLPNGQLDPSFDGDGRVRTDFANNQFFIATDITLQPDGKILVAGSSTNGISQISDIAVVRYQSDGQLDPSFDGDGWLTTDFANDNDSGHAIILQPDGKILVAGTTWKDGDNIALIRYLSDGQLDPSFDGDGRVQTKFKDDDGARDLVLRPNGTVLIAGSTSYDGRQSGSVVAQYFAYAAQTASTSGSLDPGFGTSGRVFTDIDNRSNVAKAIAIQPDGKIVTAGYSYFSYPIEGRQDIVVIRYLANGQLDPSFDGDGRVRTEFTNVDVSASAIAIQPDGKILVAGHTGMYGEIAVVRYLPDGQLDPSFDGDGRKVTDFANGSGSASAIALQPDGKILVTGFTSGDIAVVRYLPDGQLDPSFDGDGRKVTDFANGVDSASAIALQPDGKILVAGSTSSYRNGDIAVVRYLPDGQLDPSFDGDGLKATDFVNGFDSAAAMVLQPDGKILVVGYTSSYRNGDIAVVRYLPDGQLDSSFDGDGWKVTDFVNGVDRAAAMVLQPDGKILVAGSSYGDFGPEKAYYIALTRYLPDGHFDPSFDGDGLVQTKFRRGDGADALVLHPNGKILIAGYSIGSAQYDSVVAQYFASAVYSTYIPTILR